MAVAEDVQREDHLLRQGAEREQLGLGQAFITKSLTRATF